MALLWPPALGLLAGQLSTLEVLSCGDTHINSRGLIITPLPPAKGGRRLVHTFQQSYEASCASRPTSVSSIVQLA